MVVDNLLLEKEALFLLLRCSGSDIFRAFDFRTLLKKVEKSEEKYVALVNASVFVLKSVPLLLQAVRWGFDSVGVFQFLAGIACIVTSNKKVTVEAFKLLRGRGCCDAKVCGLRLWDSSLLNAPYRRTVRRVVKLIEMLTAYLLYLVPVS